jgi:hypothetical protein
MKVLVGCSWVGGWGVGRGIWGRRSKRLILCVFPSSLCLLWKNARFWMIAVGCLGIQGCR